MRYDRRVTVFAASPMKVTSCVENQDKTEETGTDCVNIQTGDGETGQREFSMSSEYSIQKGISSSFL